MSGKAASQHKHTTSDISDFPKSLPASDVPNWAKTTNKPTYTASEVGAYTKTEIDQKLGTQVTFTVSGSTLIITSK